MIDDNTILDLFFPNGIFNNFVHNKYKDNVDSEIYKYIINRFNDSKSFKESIYRIKFKVEIRPKCEYCGKELEFSGLIKNKTCFRRFCCRKCANNSETSKQKYKETCLKKYGVDNTAKSKQAKEKYIKHIREKYNDNTITNAWQAKEVIQKIKKTCLEKYGVTNFGLTKEHQIKMKSIEVVNKRNETKRKNHTFNVSKTEEESYKLLKEKYPDVIRQYKSELYPFNCDFYIPSLDLYIECNYHWTHGKHPYNPNDEIDQEKVNYWKSKNSQYWDNAITTWTIRDVHKSNIVKENNLNLIIFWKLEELQQWLKK